MRAAGTQGTLFSSHYPLKNRRILLSMINLHMAFQKYKKVNSHNYGGSTAFLFD